jgi:hypothetical protein
VLRRTHDALGAQPQVQQWLDRLAPVAAEARAALRAVKPTKLALRSGCVLDADGRLRLTFFWREYVISPGEFVVQRGDTGAESSSFTQSLILTYLAQADGTTPSGRFISFRELPSGMFYGQAFQGYAGDRLARELPVDPQQAMAALRRAAEHLLAEPLGIGDAGYIFTALPRVRLGIVYWAGDDEFPPRAQVVFEASSAHYLPTDGLAILGSQLVGHVLKAAGLENAG